MVNSWVQQLQDSSLKYKKMKCLGGSFRSNKGSWWEKARSKEGAMLHLEVVPVRLDFEAGVGRMDVQKEVDCDWTLAELPVVSVSTDLLVCTTGKAEVVSYPGTIYVCEVCRAERWVSESEIGQYWRRKSCHWCKLSLGEKLSHSAQNTQPKCKGFIFKVCFTPPGSAIGRGTPFLLLVTCFHEPRAGLNGSCLGDTSTWESQCWAGAEFWCWRGGGEKKLQHKHNFMGCPLFFWLRYEAYFVRYCPTEYGKSCSTHSQPLSSAIT